VQWELPVQWAALVAPDPDGWVFVSVATGVAFLKLQLFLFFFLFIFYCCLGAFIIPVKLKP
jgi:hypothetical protein